MQDMRIANCTMVEFERFAFETGKATQEPVEGRRFEIRYQATTGATAPGPVAIIRNHQHAIAAIGGKMIFEDQRYTTAEGHQGRPGDLGASRHRQGGPEAAARLNGRGVGPLAPVASNDTEEGRAKNRRVELVKQ